MLSDLLTLYFAYFTSITTTTTSSQGAGQASMPLRRKNYLTKNYTKN